MDRTPKAQISHMKRAAMFALSQGDVERALDYLECVKDAEMALLQEQRAKITLAKRRLSDGVQALVSNANIALNGARNGHSALAEAL